MSTTRSVRILCLTSVLGGLSGCAFVGGFDAPTVKQTFEQTNPLLVDKSQARKIKVLLIAPPTDKNTSEEEVLYVAEALKASGRFSIVSPSQFAREASKEGVSLGLMTADDRVALAQRIGKAFSADAALFITGEEVATEIGAQLLIGRGGAQGKSRAKIYAIDTGSLVWEQVQQVNLTIGAFHGVGSKEQLIKALYDPLIANLLDSFRD